MGRRVQEELRRREAMQLGEICTRNVVNVERNTSIHEAARLMRSHHVGDVIVVDRGTRGLMPVGIVTDRDIVVQVIAAGLDPAQLTAGDVMTLDLVSAPQDQGLFETVEQMHRYGVRRLPVTDKSGCLVGVVAADDLLELFAMQLSSLSKVAVSERMQELHARV
jgi:CBS domain-containing protein